jgi:tetratricopeptide (TPR) repeat protein
MRPFVFILFATLVLSVSVDAQRPGRTATSQQPRITEETSFGEAVAIPEEEARLKGLFEFLNQFPDGTLNVKARELIVSTRAAIADAKLREGDSAGAFRVFMEAIAESPEPVSDDLFAKVLLQIPINLFVADRRAEAFEAALAIEEKISDDSRKLVGLTTFYITVQYVTEAIRIAERAVAKDPDGALPRFTLAAALRLNFRLADAIDVYREILETDKESQSARLNLADLLRATGKLEESIGLYREVLDKDEDDATALAGIAVALYQTDDENASLYAERAALADPTDGLFHASIAFHLVRSGNPLKALDSADRSIAASPASSWGYIAKARAMREIGDFDESERLLIFARSFGDFPSLNYELAALRLSLGYFREAAETVLRSYDLDGDLVISYLGNRILADSDSFADLIRLERRTVTLDPMFEAEPETESRMINLMKFVKAVSSQTPDKETVLRTAEAFIAGDDSMRLHREIFIAGRMLQRDVAREDALAILRGAVGRIDEALKSPMAAPATLADDIYEARQAAFSKGERIFTPQATEQVLSIILRGRVEELTGLAFLLNGDAKQAIVRFRRAISVLPEKSAWWNSAQWRLGNALEADGNPADAVEAYIKTYDPASPDPTRYMEIERVWNLLERDAAKLAERIGPKPMTPGETVADTSEIPGNVIPRTEIGEGIVRSGLPEDVPFITTRPRAESRDASESEESEKQTEQPQSTKPSEPERPEPVKADQTEKDATAEVDGKSETASKELTDKKLAENPKSPEIAFDSVVISLPIRKNDPLNGPTSPCRLVASPSLITVSTDGTVTRIGVSSFGGDHRDVVGTAPSPEDIEISADEDSKDDRFRKFFQVRSLSGKPGTFKVMFTSPCGTKEVDIRVR